MAGESSTEQDESPAVIECEESPGVCESRTVIEVL